MWCTPPMVLSKDCSLWDVLHPCVCSGVDCFYISRFLNELDYLEVVLFQDSGICDWQQQIFFTLIWYSSSTGHGYQVWYSGKSKEKITIQCGERTTFIPSYNVDVVDELLRSMNLCDTIFLQGLIVVSKEELPLWPLCILLICIFHCLFISIQTIWIFPQ